MSDTSLIPWAPDVVKARRQRRRTQEEAALAGVEDALKEALHHARVLGDYGLLLMIRGAQRELPKAEDRQRAERNRWA